MASTTAGLEGPGRDGHFSAGKGTLNSHPTPQECSWGAGKWDGCQWQCTQSMAPIKQDLGVLCTGAFETKPPSVPYIHSLPQAQALPSHDQADCCGNGSGTENPSRAAVGKAKEPIPKAQPQGIGDSWHWPQFYCLLKHLQAIPLNPRGRQGGARATQGNVGGAGAEPGHPWVSHHTLLGRGNK